MVYNGATRKQLTRSGTISKVQDGYITCM